MNPRAAVVGFVTLTILFVLLVVLYLFSNSPPSPSISGENRDARPSVAWNGYSPLMRVFKPQELNNISVRLHLFTWFQNLFLPNDRDSPSSTPASLPQAFQTEDIAGIGIAHYNPFTSHQLAGVALLFHACRQSASDWFTLPEHRRITAEFVRLNIAILAITSSNRLTGCWSTHYPALHNYDAARVRLALRQWAISQGISHDAPFYALGVSSGATFLTVLAAANAVPSLVSQVLYFSAGNPRAIENATSAFPNTIFVRLRSDQYYAPASSVASSRITLLSKRVALVAELPLSVDSWTSQSIHEHEPLISEMESETIHMHMPGCSLDIECAVETSANKNASIARLWKDEKLRRSLVQVDRVLKGKHELSASHASHVVNWLVENGRQPAQATDKREERYDK